MKLDNDFINTALEYIPDYGGLENLQILLRRNFHCSINVNNDDSDKGTLNVHHTNDPNGIGVPYSSSFDNKYKYKQ